MNATTSSASHSLPTAAHYAGLDVGKASLHLTILGPANIVAQTTLPNSPDGHQQLVALCQEHHVQRLVLERTGGLEVPAALALTQARLRLSAVSPVQSKSFAKSLGQKAKTDLIDSLLLARMAQQLKDLPDTLMPSDLQRKLQALAARYRQLIDMQTQEKNRLAIAADKDTRRSIQKTLAFLERELKDIHKQLGKLIATDEALLQKVQQLDSAPGVAEHSAQMLVTVCPELGRLSRQEIAALAGVAPYDRQSGGQNRPRQIAGGRASLRGVMYMITLTAIRKVPRIRDYYQHLRQAGKRKIVAFVACMRKYLIMLNSMARQGKTWSEYCSQTT
jgi:transposase